MCETCRKSLKRSIYIQKMTAPLRKCCRYVNRERVFRVVSNTRSLSPTLQKCREISSTLGSGSVCRRDAKSNNLQESHPSKHFGCLNLSLQFLRSADSHRRMFLHRCRFFVVFSGKCFPLSFVFRYNFVDITKILHVM